MSDNQYLPDDLPEGSGETRPNQLPELDRTQPTQGTRYLPPVDDPRHVQPMPIYSPQPRGTRTPEKRKRRPPRDRRDSGLYLPVWSVVLMLGIVLVLAFGAVFLIANLGGQTVPSSAPRVIIVTAAPSSTPQGGSQLPSVLASPTIPPESDPGLGGTVPTVELAGPTLPPVVFSPTPDVIAIGRTVLVTGVDQNQLNIRDVPGISTNVLFRVPDGHTFTVIDGPQQTDGITWWKVEDATGQSGWAAANYLTVVPQQ